MARTSHRRIIEKISERMNNIEDKKFFLSREFSAFLTDIAESLTQRYKYREKIYVRIGWDEEENSSIAYTDNREIYINAACEYVQEFKSREAKYHVIRGFLLHEVGHMLFSDFVELNRTENEIVCKKTLSPVLLPESEEVKKFNEYLATVKNTQIRNIIYSLFAHFQNALEDANINERVMEEFPGFKRDLESNLLVMQEKAPTLQELEEVEKEEEEEAKKEGRERDFTEIDTILNMCHQFALYAECKCEAWQWKDRRMQAVMHVQDIITDAVVTCDSSTRYASINEAFATLLPYYKDDIERMKEKYGNEDNTPKSDELENINKHIKKTLGKSQVSVRGQNMNSSPTPEAKQKGCEKDNEKKGESKKESSSSLSKDNNSNREESSSENSQTESSGESKQGEKVKDKFTSDTEKLYTGKDEANEDLQNLGASEEKSNRKRAVDRLTVDDTNEKRDKLRIPLSQRVEEKKTTGYAEVVSDTERILKKMAESELCQEEEKEREKELNTFAASIEQPEIYGGFSREIKRIAQVDDKMTNAYDSLAKNIEKISKRTAKPFEKILLRKKKGEKFSGLSTGRRLETRTLPRNNGKYFSKKTMPTNHPTLSVALLVDESGSMYTGDRITYTRFAASVLYDFCQRLNIPIGVYGHTTIGKKIVLHSFAEFNTIDKKDKYRIMDMNTYGGNLDGYAMRFMAEKMLVEASADIMIQIVLSDGQPNGGSAVCEDMKAIIKKYKQKNMIIIGGAIGTDRDTVESIYGEKNFLDISNLEEMPKKLIGIIKPYIK